MDSKAQAFAEEAIRAIGRGDVTMARTSVSLAYELDHSLGAFVDAVYLSCSEVEEDGQVSTSTWNTLADTVVSGPLAAVVEASRG